MDDAAQLDMENSRFEANSASGPGGAIYVGGNGFLHIRRSTFLSNHSSDEGGAIALSDGDAAIYDTTFTYNTADASGGALAFSQGSFSLISSSTVDHNHASGDGGAFR